MLDEWMEYKQYIELSRDMTVFRLNYRNLTKSLSGLDRAMTIIARRFLFEDSFFEDGKNTPREIRANAVKEVLKAWCGFDYEAALGGDQDEGTGKDQAKATRKTKAEAARKERIEAAEKALKELSSDGREELDRIRNWFPSYVLYLLRWKLCQDSKPDCKACKKKCKQLCSDIVGIVEKTEKTEGEKGQETQTKNKRSNLAETAEEARNLCKKTQEAQTQISGAGFVKKISVDVLDKLKKRERDFAAPLFPWGPSADAAENDAKAITYESVIANAFENGALRRCVLLVKAPKGIALYKYSQKKKTYAQIDEEDNHRDTILRLTAAYLIQRDSRLQAGGNAAHKFEAVTKADVINWCRSDPKLDDIDTYFFGARSGKKPIFETCLIGGNVFKIKVDEELLQKLELRELAGKADKGQEEINALKKELAGAGACELLWDQGSGTGLERKELGRTE